MLAPKHSRQQGKKQNIIECSQPSNFTFLKFLTCPVHGDGQGMLLQELSEEPKNNLLLPRYFSHWQASISDWWPIWTLDILDVTQTSCFVTHLRILLQATDASCRKGTQILLVFANRGNKGPTSVGDDSKQDSVSAAPHSSLRGDTSQQTAGCYNSCVLRSSLFPNTFSLMF